MGLRFWRRIKIAPGLTLNLSKSGGSLSFGPRDAKFTMAPRASGGLWVYQDLGHRERALPRELNDYVELKRKRLKVFRLEAVRAGFKNARQERNYQIVIGVARKIHEKVLKEDPKLLMWYSRALTRTGED